MAIKYTLSGADAHQQYLKIEAEFPVSEEITKVYLPTWRPGRYELGNFAKNVRHFQVKRNIQCVVMSFERSCSSASGNSLKDWSFNLKVIFVV